MDRQAIDVHGRIPFSNAERNCALPKMGSKAPMAEGPVVARSGHPIGILLKEIHNRRWRRLNFAMLNATSSGLFKVVLHSVDLALSSEDRQPSQHRPLIKKLVALITGNSSPSATSDIPKMMSRRE